jgi:quercetin dioxygenase-like cupin family protein
MKARQEENVKDDKNKVEHGYTAGAHQHLDAAARHLDAPLLQLDLPVEVAALRRDRASGGAGHVAKTLAKYPDLRIVLMAFEQGGHLARHEAPGRVCIHVLEGHLVLRLGGQTVDLRAGGLLEMAPHVAHEVEAVEESAMLLTIAWPT